jgi:hypothetical protein
MSDDRWCDRIDAWAARLRKVREERGAVYGDPVENHRGIAMMMAPLLQPWAEQIGRMEPVPPWVVCNLIRALKLNRTRRTYHEDNYLDDVLYAGFAAVMQEAHGKAANAQGVGPEFGSDPWVTLASGRKFHFFGDDPVEICIEDIAHALAMQCRFKGHCSKFYSVAEHCILVSDLLPRKWAIHGLLHDAAEFVLGDAAAPVKAHLGRFAEIEKRTMARIYEALGRDEPTAEAVAATKEQDRMALAIEARALFAGGDGGWCTENLSVPADITVGCLPPDEARVAFLFRYRSLT